jgi:integrase
MARVPLLPADMKAQFTLFKRKWGIYYARNKVTGKHKSLKTRDKYEAQCLLHAYNEAANQAYLNLSMAEVYLIAADPEYITRTWQDVVDHILKHQRDDSLRRWTVFAKGDSFRSLKNLKVINTRPKDFLRVLSDSKASTNVYLRRVHNYALDMDWLLRSIIPKRQWPRIIFKKKRAITAEEHAAVFARESNPERRDFYNLLWHTGASQGDAAFLLAENVNWQQRTISYHRRKLARADTTAIKPALIRFGEEVAALLRRRPASGPLFPNLCTVRAGDRATEFKQRCDGLNIEGVTLHSYRYAWAERALKCGYPERFAQQALGHNSKAVHYAYSKNAEVIVPSLEDWETHWKVSQQVPEKPTLPPPSLPPQPPPPPAPGTTNPPPASSAFDVPSP